MTLRLFGIEVHFSFWFFAVFACFASLSRGELIFYFVLPIILHELGHIIVMGILGVKIRSISLLAAGIEIRRKPGEIKSSWRECAVILAGAGANLAAAAVLYCCFFQSMRVMLMLSANVAVAIFNLLPIGDLDGGQLFSLISERYFEPKTAYNLSRAVSFAALAALFGLAIFLITIGWMNITLLVISVYMIARVVAKG